MSALSPFRGVDFLKEFHTLPKFGPVEGDLGSVGPAPGQLIRLSRWNESAPAQHVISLMIGHLPSADDKTHCAFWHAVRENDVCAIVSVDMIGGEDPNVVPLNKYKRELYFPHRTNDPTVYKNFSHYQMRLVELKDKVVDMWFFTNWPNKASGRSVPIVPHFFLDFLRAVLQQTYTKHTHLKKPILVVGKSLDVSGLIAAVILLIHQACQEAGAGVWKCVRYLRKLCGCDVVSTFEMYEFIYDCLLQVMSATPTIMTGLADFAYMYNHLMSRPKSDFFGQSSCFVEMGSNRNVAPIQLQYAIICRLSSLYDNRLFSTQSDSGRATVRHQFVGRIFGNSVRYLSLPSFLHREQFLAVRGSVNFDALLELMSTRRSRVLLWISESPRTTNLVQDNRSDIKVSHVENYITHSTFDLVSERWTTTVIQFGGWPVGNRPVVTNIDVLHVLRSAVKYAEVLARKDKGSHVVTILEADSRASGGNTARTVKSSDGTRKTKKKEKPQPTWRGVMAALVVYLDQRMTALGEVDVYRTAQLFKMFDAKRVVNSLPQYIWCYKMAWESCLMKHQPINGDGNERFDDGAAIKKQKKTKLRVITKSKLADSKTRQKKPLMPCCQK